ncbi:MAG: class I SAM-dependent methyltransferase [Acidimicrobiia bacterium]|nr:class I SAM-dependent methyltransferase [Acidimicrobiia bacterium]
MSESGCSDEYAGIAELYDYVGPYAARPDITFYVDAAREAGGPVLEVGCGSGRVLVPTARAGIDVTGLDASPAMLDICRRRLAAEPEDVRARATLVEGDMRRFDFDRRFALATIPFRPFQHLLTPDDQLACLAAIHRHLRPGGRLVFDIFNPSLDLLVTTPFGVTLDPEPPAPLPGGRTLVRRGRVLAHDRFAQVTDHELIYDVTHPDGHTERHVHSCAMRNTFRFEAEHLLARAGFVVEHLYAGFDRSPYGSTYPGELIFVTRRA